MQSKELLTKIFTEIMPNSGMNFRKEQMNLAIEMLEAFKNNNVSMCEAEVGTGKTHAYIIASIVYNLYNANKKPSVISTSTIALQKAITSEYLPQISEILLKNKIISKALTFVVRKGKSHYICDNKLKAYYTSLKKSKQLTNNFMNLTELLGKERILDIDELKIDNYLKNKICVSECDENCGYKKRCRYRAFLNYANDSKFDFVIVNHNYLIADILVKKKKEKNLLPQFGQIIIDEAHKLPSTIKDMYGNNISEKHIVKLVKEIANARKLSLEKYQAVLGVNKELFEKVKSEKTALISLNKKMRIRVEKMCRILKRELPYITKLALNKTSLNKIKRDLSDCIIKLENLARPNENIVWSEEQKDVMEIRFLSKRLKNEINQDLWKLNIPTILTSGTISVDGDFSYLEKELGLNPQERKVVRTNAISPFNHKKQGLLYLPLNMPFPQSDDEKYMQKITEEVERLIQATHGHTLILFTSYKMMDNVFHEISKRGLQYPMFMMNKGEINVIEEFKNSKNGVLFASDSAGEGIDISGDVLSSLIIVRLPFPIPTALSEYQKSQKGNISQFMNEEIIPNMIIKLRQWFGRGIRRETDTCVFSILDSRARGKYKNSILSALPKMNITQDISEVNKFIKTKKSEEYFI